MCGFLNSLTVFFFPWMFHPIPSFVLQEKNRNDRPVLLAVPSTKKHIAIKAMAIEIVDLPIDSMVMFNSELLNVYQRVTWISWMMIH